MIKANELRVWNLIDFEGETCKVLSIDGQGVDGSFIGSGEEVWIDLFQFRPIPLTEEWLLKLGFEKTKENFCTYDLGKISIYMPSICYEEGRTYFNSWVIIEKSPKYVHQLQNLYFCLCGKELELSNQNVM